jgi:hypothetical protein
MSYYIIAKGTGLIVTDGPNRTRSYKTFGAAKATRTRLCNKAGWNESQLNIVDAKTYRPRYVVHAWWNVSTLCQARPTKKTSIPHDSCSPASEAYWSM